jgi:hypothetical protein
MSHGQERYKKCRTEMGFSTETTVKYEVLQRTQKLN